MRHLGIDYGEKRVGISLSDRDGTFAFPHDTYENTDVLLDSVLTLVQREGVERIVIGDARASGGIANPITARVEKFADVLQEKSGIPVLLAREFGTTVEASRHQGGVHNDAAAAALILQRYLDSHVSE